MADNRKKFDKILKDLGIKEEKKNTGDSIVTLFDCEKKRVNKINNKRSTCSARRGKKKLVKSKFQPMLISRSFLMYGTIKSLGMTK